MRGKRRRRHFTGPEKMAILRRHLVERIPVSQLCEEHGIHPTLFYGWQKILFENGGAVFDSSARRGRNGSAAVGRDPAVRQIVALERKLREREDKLRRKDEVLSELMEEHVALKKSLGEA